MAEFQVPLQAFTAPGLFRQRYAQNQMMRVGQDLRDRSLHEYPLLPGAIEVYQEMVTSREWKVSGSPRSVTRAIEWLNDAQTFKGDGTIDVGFAQHLNRRVLDHLCLGRTMFHHGEDASKPLRYLDPVYMTFNLKARQWEDSLIRGQKFPVKEVVVNHPKPIGATGMWVAPLGPVIPTAQLAWLVREHDMAKADGRKMRDILVVHSEALAEEIGKQIETYISLQSGKFDPAKDNIPIAFVDNVPQGSSVADLFAYLELAKIPDHFDREQFAFSYANEIANLTGLTVRQFWNIEKGTNRALEQEMSKRQVTRGPAHFIRSEQRLLRRPIMAIFGRRTRFGFIEEVDTATKKIDAEVITLFTEALKAMVEVSAGRLDGTELLKSLMGWFQSMGLLPPEINFSELFNAIQSSEPESIPDGEDEVIEESEKSPTPLPEQAARVKNVLDYGEITMSLDGVLLDYREKIFHIDQVLEKVVEEDVKTRVKSEKTQESFKDLLTKAHEENAKAFLKIAKTNKWDEDDAASVDDILSHQDSFSGEDHRKIANLLLKVNKIL